MGVVAKLRVKIQRPRVQWMMEASMARISKVKRNGLILTRKELIKSLVEKVYRLLAPFGTVI